MSGYITQSARYLDALDVEPTLVDVLEWKIRTRAQAREGLHNPLTHKISLNFRANSAKRGDSQLFSACNQPFG